MLDDLSTGAIENIRHLKHHPNFDYTIASCHERPLVAELVDEADFVYHLAALVGVELIVESPVRTIETNIHVTEVVLEAASKKKKPVFVASTSEVYGKSTAIPFREDGDLVMGPTSKGRWSYACSKAIDEFLALAYWKERGLPTVIGRMFNTVGPRQTGRYGMVIPSFVSQAIGNKPITVYGDGTQSRCFCHVHDVVRALSDLLDARGPLRRDLQHRLRDRGHDHAARRAHPRQRRLELEHRLRAVRRRLRARVRGHAAPRPGHLEDPRHARLGADARRSSRSSPTSRCISCSRAA